MERGCFLVTGTLTIASPSSRTEVAGRLTIALALLAFLYWSVSASSRTWAAEKSAVLFQELCSVCHGVGGKGDGPSAQGLEPKPADFTNCKVMAKDSDEVLLKIIKGGGQSVGRSTVMPAWGDSLSEQQIGELVKFIRGLCKK
jgi:mono/diheme cytochrome c family protein